MTRTTNPPNILIVEDNALDAQMTCWALAEAGYTGTPVVATDGVEAVALFRHETPYQSYSLPDLVILDLNLKLMDGPEVLQFIRETPELKHIKVIILSSSPENVVRTQVSSADGYFCKSSSLEVYTSLGRKILECYFRG